MFIYTLFAYYIYNEKNKISYCPVTLKNKIKKFQSVAQMTLVENICFTDIFHFSFHI